MATGRTAERGSLLAAVLLAGALLVACGSDEDSSTNDTAAPTAAPATISSTPTKATTAGSAPANTGTGGTAGQSGEYAELCALATEMFNQDSPPTAEQLTKYQQLAPPEISGAVDTAAPPLIAAGTDVVAFFNAYGKDDVEEAVNKINTWEGENCGLEHEESAPLTAGVTREVETGAARVDVVATEYAFTSPTTIDAGRTSFVLTNKGAEAHFLLIAKLAEGVDLTTAMEREDDSAFTDFWQTGIASAGGDDEAITFDLEPGNYGMLCFVPGPDGMPHAFMGMQTAFTVS